jgi:hypothetical protein
MAQPDEELVPADHLGSDERDIEAPDADAFEQALSADPADEPPGYRSGSDASPAGVHRGLEVGEWDASEQAHIVDLDDDY